jgi:multiple sugar transport system ATP-binding protein
LSGVRFEALSKTYPGRRGETPVEVLRQLDLTIEDGEFLVLVGPSGCGKSTLLRLLAGLDRPTSGEILIGDRPVSLVRPAQRNVAMVFQSYALYPHLSVRTLPMATPARSMLPCDQRMAASTEDSFQQGTADR